MKKIYNIVLESQLKAISAVKTGASTKDIDNAARNHIKSFGFGDNFGHGTGHGLGILVHELPSVSQRMEMNLPDSVVVTIEPGIYLDGTGGVRIEDDVLTINGSCEVLNKAPKELLIL
jgi:Xaa-Pro aminopeptidase